MTVKQLKQALSNLNDNAIVTISQKNNGIAQTTGYSVGFNTETNEVEIDKTFIVIRDYKIIH